MSLFRSSVKRAGSLDSGGAAADDDDPQVTILTVDDGFFEYGEHPVPQRERLGAACRAASTVPAAPGTSK